MNMRLPVWSHGKICPHLGSSLAWSQMSQSRQEQKIYLQVSGWNAALTTLGQVCNATVRPSWMSAGSSQPLTSCATLIMHNLRARMPSLFPLLSMPSFFHRIWAWFTARLEWCRWQQIGKENTSLFLQYFVRNKCNTLQLYFFPFKVSTECCNIL